MHCAELFGNIPIPCSVYKRKILSEFEKKRVTRLSMAVSAFWKSCIFLIPTNRPKLCPSETVVKTQTTVNLWTKKSIQKVTFQLEKSSSSGPSLKRENRVSNFDFPPVPLPLTFPSRSGRLGQSFSDHGQRKEGTLQWYIPLPKLPGSAFHENLTRQT